MSYAKRGSVSKWIQNIALLHASDECLLWPFARNKAGYGLLKRGLVPGTAPSGLANRVICEKVHGPAPTKAHEAAHSCGQGGSGCCSPHHLRWATRTENETDKVEHGTSNRGERQWNSKLTRPQVELIKSLVGELTHQAIADRFGVGRRQITKIANGQRWAWI
jgi:hypothetical protein